MHIECLQLPFNEVLTSIVIVLDGLGGICGPFLMLAILLLAPAFMTWVTMRLILPTLFGAGMILI